MTTITLTPDIEGPLTEQAYIQGTTPETSSSETAPEGETLFDFLQGYVGTIDGTTDALSEKSSERFAAGLKQKQQGGSL